MINFEYFKTFYFCAKYNNFTKAANALSTSQSAISHTIKNLEIQLNCRLFIRNNHGIELTPEGEKLFFHVSAGCTQFFKGESVLSEMIQLKTGTIHIATTETALHCCLLNLLKDFHNLHPDIHYKILNMNVADAINSVNNGTADFAIVPSPFSKMRHMNVVEIISFSDVLICGKQFPDLINSTISLNDISKFPFICLSTDTNTRSFFENIFLLHNAKLSVDIEPATTDIILPMVENGFGIGFIPEPLVRDPLTHNHVYKINTNECIPTRTVSCIYDTESPHSLAAKAFLSFINKIT